MQTRKYSFVESWVNLVVGYLIALVAQFLVYPALGIPVSVGQNFVIVTIFTALSLVRSYTIRRWFNSKTKKALAYRKTSTCAQCNEPISWRGNRGWYHTEYSPQHKPIPTAIEKEEG